MKRITLLLLVFLFLMVGCSQHQSSNPSAVVDTPNEGNSSQAPSLDVSETETGQDGWFEVLHEYALYDLSDAEWMIWTTDWISDNDLILLKTHISRTEQRIVLLNLEDLHETILLNHNSRDHNYIGNICFNDEEILAISDDTIYKVSRTNNEVITRERVGRFYESSTVGGLSVDMSDEGVISMHSIETQTDTIISSPTDEYYYELSSWSPNGELFSYWRIPTTDRYPYHLNVCNRNGQHLFEIEGTDSAWNHYWSTDSETILIHYYDNGANNVAVYNVNGDLIAKETLPYPECAIESVYQTKILSYRLIDENNRFFSVFAYDVMSGEVQELLTTYLQTNAPSVRFSKDGRVSAVTVNNKLIIIDIDI